jgi:D-glycero-alpha-D-manno-heptose-7-phosphate kinase
MHAMVDEAMAVLADGARPITEIGELLHEAWLLKKGLSPVVSTAAIDEIYDAGRAAGAVGGKLLGAGSGGFFLFFIPPERRPALREALGGLIEVSIEVDHDGSSIVLFEPGGFHRGYSALRRMSDAA